MTGFSDFMPQASTLHTLLLLFAVVGTVLYLYFFQGFFLMDLWYRIYRISSLSKDQTKDSIANRTHSETVLCSDYAKHIKNLKEDDFAKYRLYITKAGDNGRKPTTILMWAFVGILVVLEALGFSYLLGTWVASDSSEYVRTGLMFAIVIVLGILFPWLMHAGGHNLHQYLHYKRLFRKFKESGDNKLESGCRDLNDSQHIDDEEPIYVQAMNRIAERPQFPWVLIAAVFAIVMVLVGSTMMRVMHLERTLTVEAKAQTQQIDSGNPFAQGLPELPDAVTAPQKKVDKKVIGDEMSETKGEGFSAFVVLGVIFLMTQFIGLYIGLTRSFVGANSAEAYKSTDGFPSYAAYKSSIYPRLRLAEARLKSLQQKMEKESTSRQNYSLTFVEYLESLPDGHDLGGRTAEEKVSVPESRRAPEVVAPSPDGYNETSSVLAHLDTLQTEQEKLKYLEKLSPELLEPVRTALIQRKKQAGLATSFEGLL